MLLNNNNKVFGILKNNYCCAAAAYIALMNVIEMGEHTSVFQHYPNAAPCIPDVLLEYMSDDGGWEFLPYKHLRYYKYKCPRSGTVQYIWSCKYCTFWCDIFDTDIMNLHLCRCCSNILSADREHLRECNYERLKLQLRDIFGVVLSNDPTKTNVIES